MLENSANLSSITQNPNLVWIILGFLGVWILMLTWLVWRSYQFSQKLFGDTRKDDLKDILQDHMGRVSTVQIRLNDLERMLGQIENRSKRNLSKIGMVRFNPYEDTGGNQSFVLAFLDEEDHGVVVSSLHGRHRTRVYVKPVQSGAAVDFELSDEEQEAIRKAKIIGHK